MDNKQIEGNIFVPAHIDDVWRAWTTESGLRSFLAPECLMVPEPNGPSKSISDPMPRWVNVAAKVAG